MTSSSNYDVDVLFNDLIQVLYSFGDPTEIKELVLTYYINVGNSEKLEYYTYQAKFVVKE